MKTILLILLPVLLKASITDTIPKMDTIYPIKVEINQNELICFSSKQGQAIFHTWQQLQSCKKVIEGKDSLITSVGKENSKLVEIAQNERVVSEAQKRKADLYYAIIEEKDKQLNLSKREGVINSLSNKGNIVHTAIFCTLAGFLLGWAIVN